VMPPAIALRSSTPARTQSGKQTRRRGSDPSSPSHQKCNQNTSARSPRPMYLTHALIGLNQHYLNRISPPTCHPSQYPKSGCSFGVGFGVVCHCAGRNWLPQQRGISRGGNSGPDE
jgi:hypothetical protein